MTNNAVVLSSRQGPSTAPLPAAARPQPAALSERLAEAQELAKAGSDILPKHYNQNPGALMLAVDWANRHEVALFDVIQHVSFNRGKVTVGARLQKELAAREGFYSKPVDEGPDHCTVAVFNTAGDELGRFTFTLDMAKDLGLLSKETWKKSPEQMLYHRATTRALDRYAHGPGLATIFADDEVAEPVDIIEQVAATPTATVAQIAEPFGLNEEAIEATISHAIDNGMNPAALDRIQAGAISEWIKAQLGDAD